MALARRLVSLGRSARDDARIGVRQPLPRALLLVPDGDDLPDQLVAEVAEELNVKQVELVSDLEGLLDETVVPDFRRLGPRAGTLMPKLKETLASLDGADVRRALEAEGAFRLDVDGQTFVLEAEDVQIRASAHAELVLAREGAHAVALDTRLDDDLRLEGMARELVRRINDLRKKQDLDLADRIRLGIHATTTNVLTAAQRHEQWIADEVLAVDITVDEVTDLSGYEVLDVAGEEVAVEIERV
jgi:isoleucyl-tRNA synthetase